MLLMAEKVIRGGICQICYAVHQYEKTNNKYILKITLRLPIRGFKRVEETSQFNEYFIKSYNNDSDEE